NPMALATPEAFAHDPKLVWEWYQWRRDEATKAEPNAAHLALAELVARNEHSLIVTQNVDDLHERAGTPSERLIHVARRLVPESVHKVQLFRSQAHFWTAAPVFAVSGVSIATRSGLVRGDAGFADS